MKKTFNEILASITRDSVPKMNKYIREIAKRLDVRSQQKEGPSSAEKYLELIDSENEQFFKEFSLVDTDTKNSYWNKALKLVIF